MNVPSAPDHEMYENFAHLEMGLQHTGVKFSSVSTNFFIFPLLFRTAGAWLSSPIKVRQV